MIEKPLSSWSEYLEEVRCLARACRDRRPPPLFRGLARSGWHLETTLERFYQDEHSDLDRSFLQYYRKAAACKSAVEMLTGRRWEHVPDYGELKEMVGEGDPDRLTSILTSQEEIYEFLLYLRHHGFPSPLLDWTASPYVAAFFAFHAAVTSEADRVRVYAFVRGRSGGVFSSERQLIYVGPYGRSHARHLYQQSSYTMCVEKQPADYLIQGHHDEVMTDAAREDGMVLQFTIPVAERLEALKDLELMNLNAFSLFGSEDSLVNTLARREFIFRSR